MTSFQMIRASTLQEQDKMADLLQDYLAEFSKIVPMPMDGSGKFEYPYLAAYWSEIEKRAPYFIVESGHILGFALIRHHQNQTHEIAEFYISPEHRLQDYGTKAVEWVTHQHTGYWLAKVLQKNRSGLKFWRRCLRQVFSDATESVLDDEWIQFEWSSTAQQDYCQ